MLNLMKLYAVEILSLIMGLWLLWIIIIYSTYIRRLRKNGVQNSARTNPENALTGGWERRKKIYRIAVTFPSYFLFWVAVAIWGLSYIT